jgi:ubiquinone/menaquinone biosynthesis C-methylase UbiE
MNHADHVSLLRGGVPESGGVWADLGSGRGAFTLALADLIGPQGAIYSVDSDAQALAEQRTALARQFPDVHVHYLTADFTQPLPLPQLDGLVMANALHFVARPQQEALVRSVAAYLRPGGRLILVEYDVDDGNIWVPHPLSHVTWEQLARRAGLAHTQFLGSVPSHFLRAIYSAVSW